MLKLGTNGIGGMYIGSDSVAKAYIGSDLVYSSTPFVLPYDAEIEYLGSSGTQFIDTGIVPTATTGVYSHINRTATGDKYAMGLRDTSGNTRWCAGNNGSWYLGYGSYYSSSGISGNEADIKLNWMNDKKFYTEFSGATKTYNLPTLNFTPQNNIRLFGSAGVTGSTYRFTGTISFFKISDGSNVIMDLIPVRVGQVGYMYDKISRTLFGNDGTGSFTLGNDKTT